MSVEQHWNMLQEKFADAEGRFGAGSQFLLGGQQCLPVSMSMFLAALWVRYGWHFLLVATSTGLDQYLESLAGIDDIRPDPSAIREEAAVLVADIVNFSDISDRIINSSATRHAFNHMMYHCARSAWSPVFKGQSATMIRETICHHATKTVFYDEIMDTSIAECIYDYMSKTAGIPPMSIAQIRASTLIETVKQFSPMYGFMRICMEEWISREKADNA